jgi:ferredoxin
MSDTSSKLTRRKFMIAGSAAVASPFLLNAAGSLAAAKKTDAKASEAKASDQKTVKAGKTYYIGHQCIGCQVCRAFCPGNAINYGDCRNEIDQSKCLHCGTCYRECPICVISETEV